MNGGFRNRGPPAGGLAGLPRAAHSGTLPHIPTGVPGSVATEPASRRSPEQSSSQSSQASWPTPIALPSRSSPWDFSSGLFLPRSDILMNREVKCSIDRMQDSRTGHSDGSGPAVRGLIERLGGLPGVAPLQIPGLHQTEQMAGEFDLQGMLFAPQLGGDLLPGGSLQSQVEGGLQVGG